MKERIVLFSIIFGLGVFLYAFQSINTFKGFVFLIAAMVVYAIYMPAKGEQELPPEIIVKTQLTGKLKVSLLDSNQKLSIKPTEGEIKITIPQKMRAVLAKQEAVVIKINR